MKKSLLSIIGLTALMTLTGCDKNVTPAKANKIIFPAETITLNANSKALYVGETFKLNLYVTPLLASGGEFVYKSSDSSIASVSGSGVIKGKKQGHATVTVSSKDDPTVNAEIKLYVFAKKGSDVVASKLRAMGTYQEEHVQTPRRLRTNEVETRTLTCNGKVYHQSVTYYDFITSKDDAYFRFGINGYDVRYYDAPQMRDSYTYHFNTDVDYHSFVFKDSYEKHNYCYVASEFYLGTETTRDQVVDAMLNSFFVSGTGISENNIEDSMSTDMLTTYAGSCSDGGYATDEVYAVFGGGGRGTSTPTMENNLDIPAGVQYIETDDIRLYWYQGNVKSYKLHFILDYTVNDKKYSLDIDREYTFQRDNEFSFVMPTLGNYTRVDTIFDL